MKPYSADALAAAQRQGSPVVLHFHADWCPTCRAQQAALEKLKARPDLGITVLVANYDTERALKAKHKVVAQSTLIVFKGTNEVARLAGETREGAIESALRKAL